MIKIYTLATFGIFLFPPSSSTSILKYLVRYKAYFQNLRTHCELYRKYTPEYENTVAPHKSKKERKKLKLKCLNKIFKMTIIII